MERKGKGKKREHFNRFLITLLFQIIIISSGFGCCPRYDGIIISNIFKTDLLLTRFSYLMKNRYRFRLMSNTISQEPAHEHSCSCILFVLRILYPVTITPYTLAFLQNWLNILITFTFYVIPNTHSRQAWLQALSQLYKYITYFRESVRVQCAMYKAMASNN